MSFPSFTKSDFLAFEEKKQKSKRYNKERKPVWEKLKQIMDFVDIGLEKKGISLQAKVSNYWPNMYNHYRVNGVWIGYSDRDKKYYEFPHLSIGVYDGYIFVGFVINERAVEYQEFFAEMVESQPDLFLNYFNQLNKDRRVIWYDDLEILENPKKKQFRELSEKIGEDWGWLSVGEFLSKKEYLSEPEKLLWIILDVFEVLHP